MVHDSNGYFRCNFKGIIIPTSRSQSLKSKYLQRKLVKMGWRVQWNGLSPSKGTIPHPFHKKLLPIHSCCQSLPSAHCPMHMSHHPLLDVHCPWYIAYCPLPNIHIELPQWEWISFPSQVWLCCSSHCWAEYFTIAISHYPLPNVHYPIHIMVGVNFFSLPGLAVLLVPLLSRIANCCEYAHISPRCF